MKKIASILVLMLALTTLSYSQKPEYITGKIIEVNEKSFAFCQDGGEIVTIMHCIPVNDVYSKKGYAKFVNKKCRIKIKDIGKNVYYVRFIALK